MTSQSDPWSRWLNTRRDAGSSIQRQATLDWLAPIRDQVLDNAEPLAGITLLDVGCGEGLIGLAALGRVGATGAVIFSDISGHLLEQVERSARAATYSAQTQFALAGAEDLNTIPDRSVDVVTTRSVLIYVADKQSAFRAMHRVLRPGGRISLFEPINKLMYPEAGDRFAGYDVTAVRPLADRVKRSFTALSDPKTRTMVDFDDRDLVQYAIRAGFPQVRLTLQLSLSPGAPRAVSFDNFLDSAPNPLSPTLREQIEHALAGAERNQFMAHLRRMFDTSAPTQLWAGAYLTAVKDRL